MAWGSRRRPTLQMCSLRPAEPASPTRLLVLLEAASSLEGALIRGITSVELQTSPASAPETPAQRLTKRLAPPALPPACHPAAGIHCIGILRRDSWFVLHACCLLSPAYLSWF